jgi:hypothetical protein
MPNVRKRLPMSLFVGLLGINVAEVALNSYNVLRRPGESGFWLAATALSDILVLLGTGLFIWGRYAKSREN